MLYTFRMTFAKCNLVQTSSSELDIGTDLESTISSATLGYQTHPVRSDTTAVRYVINQPPKYGYLLSAVSKYRMRAQDSFTAEDVLSKYVKYQLYRKAYSDIKDVVHFAVTAPGCKNVTGNFTILHHPGREIASRVKATISALKVDEGSSARVTRAHLDIESVDVSSLVFNVTKLPANGILQVDSGAVRNGTSYFTLKELHNGQVGYVIFLYYNMALFVLCFLIHKNATF